MASTFAIAGLIKTALATAVWPGLGGERVFGKVIVSAGIDGERYRSQVRWPYCLILPAEMEVDDEEPDLVTQKFTILIAHAVAGDTWGETVIMGGAGPGTGLTSKGRGLLELEQVLFDAIALLSEQDGVRIQLISASAVAAELDAEVGYVAQRQYTWSAWTGAGSSP